MSYAAFGGLLAQVLMNPVETRSPWALWGGLQL
jgi:hypothetical protein